VQESQVFYENSLEVLNAVGSMVDALYSTARRLH
jgi:hypothetical protein